MKKLGRALSLTTGLAVAVALVGHFNSGTTQAVATDPTKVVNSTSASVPVAGTAKANQNSSRKVVNGSDPEAEAKVASTEPVPVQSAPSLSAFNRLVQPDLENPEVSAFQASCTAGGAGIATCTLPKLPAAKALVIETVSAAMSISGNAPPLFTSLTTTAGGMKAKHFFSPALTGLAGLNLSFYSVNMLVRIYADPGSTIIATVESTTAGSPQVTWTISGHFVCTNYQTTC